MVFHVELERQCHCVLSKEEFFETRSLIVPVDFGCPSFVFLCMNRKYHLLGGNFRKLEMSQIIFCLYSSFAFFLWTDDHKHFCVLLKENAKVQLFAK